MNDREASREKFEEFAKTDPAGFMLPTTRYDVEMLADGDYVYGRTEAAWLAWQASRQQALEEAMEACNERAAAYDILVNTQAVMGCDDCLVAIRSISHPTGGKE